MLMLWRDWYSDLFGVAHCEEVCERMLGRFKERLLSHTDVFSAEDACDLYLTVKPGVRGFKGLRPDAPSRGLVDMVSENLRRFAHSSSSVLTHVPWASGRTVRAVGRWPSDFECPAPLLGDVTVADGKRMGLHLLGMMCSAKAPEARLRAALDACVPRRPDGDVALLLAAQAQLRAAIRSNPIPRPRARARQAAEERPQRVPRVRGGHESGDSGDDEDAPASSAAVQGSVPVRTAGRWSGVQRGRMCE